MLADLSFPLEEYYNTPNVENMRDYLVRQYEENLLWIHGGVLTLIRNPEDQDMLKKLSREIEKIKGNFKLYSPMLEKSTTLGEYVSMTMDKLQKLIDELKKNEDEFYREALISDRPNFLITSYYSLYLRFITKVYLKLRGTNITNSNMKTNDPRIKDIFNITNFLVGFFGMPILIYIKTKEVVPHISELSVILLHALVTDRISMGN